MLLVQLRVELMETEQELEYQVAGLLVLRLELDLAAELKLVWRFEQNLVVGLELRSIELKVSKLVMRSEFLMEGW
jgi:hypothetical protein